MIELGNLPCAGLNAVFVNGEKVTLLTAEAHASYGYPVSEYRKGGKDYLWIKFYDGTQTTADAYLTEKFSTDPDRPWSASMIGRGCPYAIVTARFNKDLHKSVPTCVFELQSIPLYDIRKDSTNGGSGLHRWDNPSTWEPSVNPVVQAYNVIRGIYYAGEWFYGGQNVNVNRLPSSAWIAAAQECGHIISLSGGGTEPAYRSSYQIQGNETGIDAVRELAKAANMRLAEVGGVFKPLVGAPGSAVYSFTDDDILVTEGQSLEPFPSLDETINGIEASYPEPSEVWASKTAPARYDATLEAADGDRRLLTNVDFKACPFANQVQRLMVAILNDARKFRVHQFFLPPDAYPLEPNDVVSWTSDRNGYANKKFLVEAIVGRPTINQLVTLREIDPADYDWSTDLELPTAVGWTGPIIPPAQAFDGWEVQPDTIYDAANNARRPAIKVLAPDDLDDVRNVRVQVRRATTTAIIFDVDSLPYSDPWAWILNGTFLPAQTYEVRGKLIPYSTRTTEWSAWLEVILPDIRLTSDDLAAGAVSGDVLADNSVIAQKLADSAVTASKIMDEAVTELKVANQAISTAKLALAAVTADIIANGAVLGTKLADAAVTAQKIADEAITATKFAASLKPVEIVSELPATGNVEGRVVYLSTDDKLYRYTGAAWTAAVAATDVTGQLTDAQIAAVAAAKLTGQITSTQITDGAISTPKLAAGSVSTDKLAAGSVIAEKLAAEAITAEKLAAGSVTTAKLAAGSVTADILAVNSVTAGKVVAGAIGTTQLAAGAVTTSILAAGAITADKLAVGGGGRNRIVNSDFAAGMTGWSYFITGGEWLVSVATNTYAVPTGSLQVIQTGAASYGQFADVIPVNPDGSAVEFSVAAGTRYEISAYVFGHRSDYCRAHIKWTDAAGTTVGYSFADAPTHQNFDPQKNLANYVRVGVIGQAPATAAYCRVFFRCWGHSATYGTDSYTWVAFPYFGEATVNQTELSPWAPTGVTLIEGGNIVTNAITALHLSTGSVTADKIAAGSVTTEKLVAGSVTGEKVAALTITGDKIAANTIGADKIAANSITAKQLVLTDFSNLVPDNQMIDIANWSGPGWQLWDDHNLMSSYNVLQYYAGPWGSGGYTVALNGKSFPVKGGASYWIGGSSYSNDNYECLLRIHWIDGNGAIISYVDYLITGARGPGMQTANVSLTAPGGARTASLAAYVQRDNTTGPVYVGSMSVRERNAADLIVDGAITANKLSVNSLSAVSANCGTLTAGVLQSSNGKMVIDLNAGTIVISS
ncbi:phage tail protein [Ciceribacter thiooxidans]|uniref:Phage tail protein n=1 Tax=Ciceribacter thiooxidans TaxID=1969821 RepID=A0ABV7I2A3_9HYPH|nr:phage tail protein [Ciceribacter thiooxidans]